MCTSLACCAQGNAKLILLPCSGGVWLKPCHTLCISLACCAQAGVKLISLPSKRLGLFTAAASTIIARSDSNGEDLEAFAGAGMWTHSIWLSEELDVLFHTWNPCWVLQLILLYCRTGTMGHVQKIIAEYNRDYAAPRSNTEDCGTSGDQRQQSVLVLLLYANSMIVLMYLVNALMTALIACTPRAWCLVEASDNGAWIAGPTGLNIYLACPSNHAWSTLISNAAVRSGLSDGIVCTHAEPNFIFDVLQSWLYH